MRRRWLLSVLVLDWMALNLACGGDLGGPRRGAARPPPPPPPAENIILGDVDVNANCGGVFDYCVRVDCALINLGDGSGSVTVRFEVFQNAGTLTHDEHVFMASGERRDVRHDFPEAVLEDRGATGQCTIHREGEIEGDI